ncbi:serine hydrolase [Limnohabitans sp. Rim8]|uniref:serine hydrolase domain-containing protein n=1 Tax=Limnohabitans sp. Rim8 TaxID=1100718 RepID=UPI0025DC1E2E|nr:serine hydrolase [Limnohabitans sp. Rim8]
MKKNSALIMLVVVFLLSTHNSFAQRPLPAEGAQPHGIKNFCAGVSCVDSLWMYKRIYKSEPAMLPYSFERVTGDRGFFGRILSSKADTIFDANPIIAMMLIEKNKILYERYKGSVNSQTAFAGFSMTKSIASLTVGQAVCENSNINLDVKSSSLNNLLSGSVQGDATIRQLLTMSSGGNRGTLSMGGWPVGGENIGNSNYAGYKSIPTLIKDHGGRQLLNSSSGESVQSGVEFSYKNTDYAALSLVLSGQSPDGFFKIFNSGLAPLVGFENPVYWVHDEHGYTHTSTSFHASLIDWGRLAQFILNKINDKTDSCLSRYIRDATKTQIKNKSSAHGSNFYSGSNFGGYGFGFWTENHKKPKAIYMVGANGQRIGIDPNSEKVMVVISTDDSSVRDIFNFFGQW